ncbi:MAG: type II toxin-antitoxin system HicA family toxin [Ginsengibacter sp.]
MRIPRDISSNELIKLLKKFGYEISRQKGSHIRLTTFLEGEHHVTIPNHNPIRLGTLSSILFEVADHFKKTKEEITNEIF